MRCGGKVFIVKVREDFVEKLVWEVFMDSHHKKCAAREVNSMEEEEEEEEEKEGKRCGT